MDDFPCLATLLRCSRGNLRFPESEIERSRERSIALPKSHIIVRLLESRITPLRGAARRRARAMILSSIYISAFQN